MGLNEYRMKKAEVLHPRVKELSIGTLRSLNLPENWKNYVVRSVYTSLPLAFYISPISGPDAVLLEISSGTSTKDLKLLCGVSRDVYGCTMDPEFLKSLRDVLGGFLRASLLSRRGG